MIILGKSKDDKGTQLEKLVVAILKKLGYTNVVPNKIGSGGEELDVTGGFVVPLPGGEITKRLIAECKAYKKPVDIPTWLKFLGKLFTDEQKTGEKVSGCLIALSGVNGNCQGAYEDLKARRSDITIIAGEALFHLLEELYSLKKASEIEALTRQLTDRTIRLLDVVYYDANVYWVVGFQDEKYALLDSSGKTLEREKANKLTKLIKKSEALGQYIDLEEEARARETALEARKHVLQTLIEKDGSAPAEELTASSDLAPEIVHAGIEYLKAQGIVQQDSTTVYIPDPVTSGYKHVPSLYRELLFPYFDIRVLGKPYYDRHINNGLLDEVVAIQCGITLTDEQRQRAVELMRLSPGALLHCVMPMAMIVNHRQKEKNQVITVEINKADVDYFFQTLHQCLRHDFGHGQLAEYFHETRSLVELDTSYTVKLKSQKELKFQDEVRVRTRLGQLAPEMVQGQKRFVVMLAINDGPEPWDWDDWVKNRTEQNATTKQAQTDGAPLTKVD
jgi:Restriction endonuclease